MAKGGKTSSASSTTRKKQAAKKAEKLGQREENGQRKPPGDKQKTKGLTKQEKKALKHAPKQYIPPPKPPQPALPDPLDAQGLAKILPAELVVVLRRLGKKDAVTKRKGLEELRDGWINVITSEGGGEDAELEKELKEQALVDALPVWLHNLPALLVSPAHRQLALQTQTSFIKLDSVRSSMIRTLNLGLLAGEHQCRDIVGSWLSAAVEEGRRPGGRDCMAAFERVADWSGAAEPDEAQQLNMPDHLANIVGYLRLATLAPAELHEDIHPPPLPSTSASNSGRSTPAKTSKSAPHPFISEMSAASYEQREADEKARQDAAVIEEETFNRYRFFGLLALTYVLQSVATLGDLESFLQEESLWDLVASGTPPVRRAVYLVIQALVTKHHDFCKERLVAVIGSHLLSNVWKEEDAGVWSGGAVSEALLLFLTKFRQVWLLDGQAGDQNEDDNKDDDASDSSEDSTDGAGAGHAGFESFLSFLQKGCNGFPAEGYPTLLVVLSTVPEQILPLERDALERLFTSLWAPVYARLLSSHSLGGNNAPILDALTAIIDSLIYLGVKAARASSEEHLGSWIVQEYRRIWADGVLPELTKLGRADRSMMGEKRTPGGKSALAAGQALARLYDALPETAEQAFDATCEAIIETFRPSEASDERSRFAGRFYIVIDALRDTLGDRLNVNERTTDIACKTLRSSLAHLGQQQSEADIRLITQILDRYPEASDAEVGRSLETFLDQNAAELLTKQEGCSLYASFMNLPQSSESAQQMWILVSQVISRLPAAAQYKAAESMTLTWKPRVHLSAEGTKWADICEDALSHSLQSDDEAAFAFVRGALTNPQSLLDEDDINGLYVLAATAVHGQVDDALHGHGQLHHSSLSPALDILALRKSTVLDVFRPALVDCGLLSRGLGDLINSAAGSTQSKAKMVWENAGLVEAELQSRLRDLVSSVECVVHPSQLVTHLKLVESYDDLLNGLVQAHKSQPLPNTLSIVVDDLLPYESTGHASSISVDCFGRSSYARLVEATISTVDVGSVSPQLLYHLTFTAGCARDELAASGGSRLVFGQKISADYLNELIDAVDRVLSYAVTRSDVGSPEWHIKTVQRLQKREAAGDLIGRLLGLYLDDADADSRNLCELIDRLLRSVSDKTVAERWFLFGYSRHGMTARAICGASSRHLVQSPRLDRARNEIASDLTGVKAQQANEKGLEKLRLLTTIAPTSGEEFIPTQRAIFLMQHLNSWLLSDEDISEEVEAHITLLFSQLAPSVHTVTGNHWDNIFDMISNNLDAASLDNAETYNLTWVTLRLLDQVSTLAQSSKTLRDAWMERPNGALLKLLLTLDKDTPQSLSLSKLLAMAVQSIPEDVTIQESQLEALYQALTFAPLFVQRTIVGILSRWIRDHTQAMVIEFESAIGGRSDASVPQLSETLLSVSDQSHLAWILIFEHFSQASTGLRNAFIEQLRKTDALSHLLPRVMDRLRKVLPTKVGEIAPFAVDEFHVQRKSDVVLIPVA